MSSDHNLIILDPFKKNIIFVIIIQQNTIHDFDLQNTIQTP